MIAFQSAIRKCCSIILDHVPGILHAATATQKSSTGHGQTIAMTVCQASKFGTQVYKLINHQPRWNLCRHPVCQLVASRNWQKQRSWRLFSVVWPQTVIPYSVTEWVSDGGWIALASATDLVWRRMHADFWTHDHIAEAKFPIVHLSKSRNLATVEYLLNLLKA